MAIVVEVIGPGGNVIDKVRLQLGQAVRIGHPIVRLSEDDEVPEPIGEDGPAAGSGSAGTAPAGAGTLRGAGSGDGG